MEVGGRVFGRIPIALFVILGRIANMTLHWHILAGKEDLATLPSSVIWSNFFIFKREWLVWEVKVGSIIVIGLAEGDVGESKSSSCVINHGMLLVVGHLVQLVAVRGT